MSLPFAPAAERNQAPIAAVLARWLPCQGTVLEIGAGTGQHAVAFAARFTDLAWQPTEHPDAVSSLAPRIEGEGGDNVLPPLALDVLADTWPAGPYQAAFSANTAHIMPWAAVTAMFAGIGRVLVAGASFCLYGPFRVGGAFTTDGNRAFDAGLRARDAAMGLRDIDALDSLAREHHMVLADRCDMPADNFMLRFLRD